MAFNSITYILFLTFVVIIYYLIQNKYRSYHLLISSYIFYSFWNPFYLVLIIFSTFIDYLCAIYIEKSTGLNRRLFLILSITSNLTLLFIFKYYNFFIDSLNYWLNVDKSQCFVYHNFLLPVGISFYTFQTLSYSVDVFRGQKAEKRFCNFALYVTFFPQLIAGPIERSKHLLSQFSTHIKFSNVDISIGVKKIIFGLFKKLVVADRLAIYVDAVYTNPGNCNSSTILLATFFFAFQIYCDFSAYSDIAVGSARLLGIKLIENFMRPYFSGSLNDFWRRWHISLSTWFRDYVYIPLGGNRNGQFKLFRNILIVFILSGIWHGANSTFLLWGLFHGIGLVISATVLTNFNNYLCKYRGLFLYKCITILITFIFVNISWIIFRSNTLDDCMLIVTKLTNFKFILPKIEMNCIYGLFAIFMLLAIEFIKEFYSRRFIYFSNKYFIINHLYYGFLLMLILLVGVFDGSQFIYFQF